jgi:FixJ family two-component response regulator
MSVRGSTVFIVDDDPSVCRSLSRLVRQAQMDVETYVSAEDFLSTQARPMDHPTCLVVDLQMPGVNGLELQRRLSSRSASCPVIFISGHGDIPATVLAMKQGAVTFLPKPFDGDDLLSAITEALEKHRAQLASGSKVHAVEEHVNDLTEREREVMSWVITGALNKQIAAQLGIVERTVKVHRARVMEKMQVSSVAELVRQCSLVGVEAAVV